MSTLIVDSLKMVKDFKDCDINGSECPTHCGSGIALQSALDHIHTDTYSDSTDSTADNFSSLFPTMEYTFAKDLLNGCVRLGNMWSSFPQWFAGSPPLVLVSHGIPTLSSDIQSVVVMRLVNIIYAVLKNKPPTLTEHFDQIGGFKLLKTLWTEFTHSIVVVEQLLNVVPCLVDGPVFLEKFMKYNFVSNLITLFTNECYDNRHNAIVTVFLLDLSYDALHKPLKSWCKSDAIDYDAMTSNLLSDTLTITDRVCIANIICDFCRASDLVKDVMVKPQHLRRIVQALVSIVLSTVDFLVYCYNINIFIILVMICVLTYMCCVVIQLSNTGEDVIDLNVVSEHNQWSLGFEVCRIFYTISSCSDERQTVIMGYETLLPRLIRIVQRSATMNVMTEESVLVVSKLTARVIEFTRRLLDNDGISVLLTYFMLYHTEEAEGPCYALGTVARVLKLPDVEISSALRIKYQEAFDMNVRAYDSEFAIKNYESDHLVLSLLFFEQVIQLKQDSEINSVKWLLNCCFCKGTQGVPLYIMLIDVLAGKNTQHLNKLSVAAKDKVMTATRSVVNSIYAFAVVDESVVPSEYKQQYQELRFHLFQSRFREVFALNDVPPSAGAASDSTTTNENQNDTICSSKTCGNIRTKKRMSQCSRCRQAHYCGKYACSLN
jgi:hypothetical protein